jgi:uncharacterized membrane protein YfcA
LSAFAGAAIGSRLLARVTMVGIRRVVAVMLFAVALGLGAGIL